MEKRELSKEEKRVFEEISWAIGNGKPHPLEHIVGVPVKKDERKKYMSLFVGMDLYRLNGENYTITNKGGEIFRRMKDAASRRAALGRLPS